MSDNCHAPLKKTPPPLPINFCFKISYKVSLVVYLFVFISFTLRKTKGSTCMLTVENANLASVKQFTLLREDDKTRLLQKDVDYHKEEIENVLYVTIKGCLQSGYVYSLSLEGRNVDDQDVVIEYGNLTVFGKVEFIIVSFQSGPITFILT